MMADHSFGCRTYNVCILQLPWQHSGLSPLRLLHPRLSIMARPLHSKSQSPVDLPGPDHVLAVPEQYVLGRKATGGE